MASYGHGLMDLPGFVGVFLLQKNKGNIIVIYKLHFQKHDPIDVHPLLFMSVRNILNSAPNDLGCDGEISCL